MSGESTKIMQRGIALEMDAFDVALSALLALLNKLERDGKGTVEKMRELSKFVKDNPEVTTSDQNSALCMMADPTHTKMLGGRAVACDENGKEILDKDGLPLPVKIKEFEVPKDQAETFVQLYKNRFGKEPAAVNIVYADDITPDGRYTNELETVDLNDPSEFDYRKMNHPAFLATNQQEIDMEVLRKESAIIHGAIPFGDFEYFSKAGYLEDIDTPENPLVTIKGLTREELEMYKILHNKLPDDMKYSNFIKKEGDKYSLTFLSKTNGLNGDGKYIPEIAKKLIEESRIAIRCSAKDSLGVSIEENHDRTNECFSFASNPIDYNKRAAELQASPLLTNPAALDKMLTKELAKFTELSDVQRMGIKKYLQHELSNVNVDTTKIATIAANKIKNAYPQINAEKINLFIASIEDLKPSLIMVRATPRIETEAISKELARITKLDTKDIAAIDKSLKEFMSDKVNGPKGDLNKIAIESEKILKKYKCTDEQIKEFTKIIKDGHIFERYEIDKSNYAIVGMNNKLVLCKGADKKDIYLDGDVTQNNIPRGYEIIKQNNQVGQKENIAARESALESFRDSIIKSPKDEMILMTPKEQREAQKTPVYEYAKVDYMKFGKVEPEDLTDMYRLYQYTETVKTENASIINAENNLQAFVNYHGEDLKITSDIIRDNQDTKTAQKSQFERKTDELEILNDEEILRLYGMTPSDNPEENKEIADSIKSEIADIDDEIQSLEVEEAVYERVRKTRNNRTEEHETTEIREANTRNQHSEQDRD